MALKPKTTDDRANQLAARKSAEQDVLMREVDEAVRRDQLEDATRRYAVPVGIALLVALLAFGAWLFWRDRQESQMEQRSEQLVLALDELEAGEFAQADKDLEPLATGEGDAVSIAAGLTRAGIALRDNRRDDAMRIYEQVAGNASAPQSYRDLATIRLVALQFDQVQPDAVIDRLKPIAVPGNAWFGSAGELLAMAYLKQGREDLAGPLLAQITKDETVPETLRSRTRQLAGLLGVDTVDDAELTLSAAGEQAEQAPGSPPAPAQAPAPAAAQ